MIVSPPTPDQPEIADNHESSTLFSNTDDLHNASTDTFLSTDNCEVKSVDQQMPMFNEDLNDNDPISSTWCRSIEGCSGLPGVPCCHERNFQSLTTPHKGELLNCFQ